MGLAYSVLCGLCGGMGSISAHVEGGSSKAMEEGLLMRTSYHAGFTK